MNLAEKGNALAVIDADRGISWTYRMLSDRVQHLADRLRVGGRALLLLLSTNDTDSFVLYLAALKAGHAVFLLSARLQDSAISAIVETYRPELIAGSIGNPTVLLERGYFEAPDMRACRVFVRLVREDPPPHETLALTMATSASSGSPKLARISSTSLATSASQVMAALAISETHRPLLGLPISYVYGLSVLNSALYAGASIAVVRTSPIHREYWAIAKTSQVTIIPAVSQTLEYMRSLRINLTEIPSVKSMTHSGEALNPGLLEWTLQSLEPRRVLLYLMYGQTEACGRIAVLPPDCLAAKRGSVGKAIPGGEIALANEGEIVYRGPGVMLGYATRREDLSLGDTLHGCLNTGDTGHLDADGFLYITGRLTRYRKLFGQRVNLDEIESCIRTICPAAVVESRGLIIIFLECNASVSAVSAMELGRRFQLPPQSFCIKSVAALPRTDRGKIDYRALRNWV